MRTLAGHDLPSAFLERASLAPDAPALALPGRVVAYGELRSLALGAAARLDELGLEPGRRVAVGGPKSPETIALVLGCLLTGRPALLPPADLRPDVLGALLDHAGVGRLLAAHPVDGAVEVEPAAGRAAATDGLAPSDVALMLTTSGSTGLPKVVPLAHGPIGRFADWASAQFGIAAGTRVLSFCGLNFDLSLLEVWTTLARGGTAVLVEPERSIDGRHLTELISTHEVGLVQGVPLLYRLLLDARGAGALPNVRHAILTGDTTPLPLLERLPALLPEARLWNVYGCTETNDSFLFEIDVDRVLELGALPLGEPAAGIVAHLVEGDRVVDGAGAGELWVSTPFQTTGYLGPRGADAFAVDPTRRTDLRFFRSRDLVRRDGEGRLFLQGRTDLQVKVRGHRVNLEAVEQALLEHPDMVEAAVVALDDERAGKRLCAHVRRSGAGLTALALRRHCVGRLARAAVPSIIEAQDDPLPRTSAGKVDREEVRRRAEARAHG